MAACPDEASDFFAFMTTAAAVVDRPGHGLQIMFGVGGEHDLTERELGHLPRLAGQPPGPGRQRRLEPAADRRLRRAARRGRAGSPTSSPRIDDDTRRFLIACADTAATHWGRRTRASGRSAAIRSTSSTPRSCAGSRWTGRSPSPTSSAPADRVERWKQHARRDLGDRPPRRLERRGRTRSPSTSARTALDASNLMMAIVGFLPADDPRMLATIDAIEDAAHRRSRAGLPLPHRGRRRRPGRRGGHLPAVHLLAGPGAGPAPARSTGPERCSSGRPPSSTTSACWPRRSTPTTGELLGNFPQAFSHIGLVNAAWAISQAEQRMQADLSA